jgi:N-acetylglucosaminyl-diphospho-decaprenol L-rhamnosyltransferase
VSDAEGPFDVSIVVVAHDVRDELLRCLESIAEHAPPLRVETIVVDNGSRDGTAAAVAAAHPAAVVVRLERNVGMRARNEGLRRARGRHRMFLDSDARLTAGALARLVATLDERPDAGLVGPRLVHADGSLQLSCRRQPSLVLPLLRRPPLARWFEDGRHVARHLMRDDRLDRPREVEYVIGACQLFTAAAQRAAGEIDPWMFYGPDDADWCLRIRAAGWRVVYEPRAAVVHDYRRATASRPLSRAALLHLVAFYRFQWKWRGRRRWIAAAGRELDARAGELPPGGSPPEPVATAAGAARG